jgi:hypothetical protein
VADYQRQPLSEMGVEKIQKVNMPKETKAFACKWQSERETTGMRKDLCAKEHGSWYWTLHKR